MAAGKPIPWQLRTQPFVAEEWQAVRRRSAWQHWERLAPGLAVGQWGRQASRWSWWYRRQKRRQELCVRPFTELATTLFQPLCTSKSMESAMPFADDPAKMRKNSMDGAGSSAYHLRCIDSQEEVRLIDEAPGHPIFSLPQKGLCKTHPPMKPPMSKPPGPYPSLQHARNSIAFGKSTSQRIYPQAMHTQYPHRVKNT